MVTTVIPAGRRIYNGEGAIDWPTTDLVEAETNDPFFLADYLQWEATPSASRNAGWAYPCQVDALASGYIWQGGRFIGNIPANHDRSGPDGFYTSGTPQRYNSAIMHLRLSVPGTLRQVEFGILGDPNSGFCDGLRAANGQTAKVTLDRCIFSNARDDAIEADTTSAPIEIVDSLFEDVYSWVSATGNGNTMTGKVIDITRTVCKFRAWPENSGNSQIGPVFKIDGAGNAPVFNMTDVTLVIPSSWPESGYNRTRGALTRMNCVRSDLLVMGGTLSNSNGLRDAFLAAGWNIIENQAQVDSIYASRRAAQLAVIGGGGGPVVEPSLTSPITVNSVVP